MAWWLTFLIAAALFVVVELIRPKPQLEDAKPAGLGDFTFPTATEGRVVPAIWGTVQTLAPNVVWYGDFRQVPIRERIKTGLFSSDRVTIGFHYYVGVQCALCRGPDVSLLRMWIGDRVVFSGTVTHDTTFSVNEPNLFGGDKLGAGGFVGTFRLFSGQDDQNASVYLSQFQQQGGNTPAYRGTCYIVTETGTAGGGYSGAYPTYVGNSTSIKPWKFEIQRLPDPLSVGAVNGGLDVNPANVIYEVLTDEEFIGEDASRVDSASFLAAATTLASEGNGFSMILDRAMDAFEFIQLVADQADGIVFFDQKTGKWKFNLVRDDYTIGSEPEITDSDIVEIKSYSQGTWDETRNIVTLPFHDRDDDYKETYAQAQDMASIAIMQGRIVDDEIRHPGVKDATLANAIAWRELRTLAYPLAKLDVIVKRTFYALQPGNIVGFSGTIGGTTFDKLPMRVNLVDLNEFEDDRITIALVQDVFYAQAGSFADPPDTGWSPPEDDLDALPSDEQVAFEAPAAFVYRDPSGLGVGERIWGGGQHQGDGAVSIVMRQRNATGTPAGAYAETGELFGFLLLGTLTSDLDAGTATPTTTVNVTPWSGLTQAALEAVFEDNPNLADQGVNLINLVLIDEEFMLVQAASTGAGSTVDLEDVYRAVLDSVQANHSAGASVYLLFLGGGLSEDIIASPRNVDVLLLPRSRYDTVAEGDATKISFQMDSRYLRPYPPSILSLGGTDWDSSASLEGNGSDAEDYGIDLDIIRRDFRIADGGDEIASLETDAGTLFADFPSVNSTEHEVDVIDDPSGSATLLFTDTFSGSGHTPLRIEILKETDGVLPTEMRFTVRAKHTVASTVYASRQELTFDFAVTTALTGQFNFGALDASDVSNLYTATVAGTYAFTLSSAFTLGDVEYRLNGGSWTTLISAGGTSGSIVGVSISDEIEVRHLSTDTGALKQLDMAAAGAGQDGYAILYT